MPEPNMFRPDVFSERLYEKIKRINPGISELELYEFRYALDNVGDYEDTERHSF